MENESSNLIVIKAALWSITFYSYSHSLNPRLKCKAGSWGVADCSTCS